jgi:arylsulfatase A-like enzyme
MRTTLPRHGIDLSATMRGHADPALSEERVSIHEDAHNRVVMARRGPWKLIVSVSNPWFARDRIALFHLPDDPRETRNVAGEHPEIVAELRPHLDRWVQAGAWRKVDADVDPEEVRRLKALGYVEEDAPPP